MTTQLERASELLFGTDGLGVSNVKLFPGSNRDATEEDIAEQIANAIEDIQEETGEAELA